MCHIFKYYLTYLFSFKVRRHCVLFSVDPIRAIITPTKLLLVVSPGADSVISILEDYMKDWMPGQLTPSSSSYHFNSFELHCYDSILSTIKDMQQQEYQDILAREAGLKVYYKSGKSMPALSIQVKSIRF